MKQIVLIIAMATFALVSCNKEQTQEAPDDEIPTWLKKKGSISDEERAANKAKEDALLKVCGERDALYAGYIKILETNVGNPTAAAVKMKAYIRIVAPKIKKLNDEIHPKILDHPDAESRCMKGASKVSSTLLDRFHAVIEKMGDQEDPIRELKKKLDDAFYTVRIKR